MPKKTSLSRRDWLDAAYDALLRGGRAGVKVEVLARDLGVTKGSFYWHFENRDDLLRALLEDWSERLTDQVLAEVSAKCQPPRQSLLLLIQTITKRHAGRHDLEIRAWARYDATAARYVRRVDRRRLSFVLGLFEEMGFSGIEAQVRARMYLHYQVAEPTIQIRDTAAHRDELARARHRLLTAGAPRSRRPKRTAKTRATKRS